MNNAASIRRLRIIGLVEGISFLVLGAAMIFKYGMGQPIGVKIAGPIHGGLFLLYLIALIHAWMGARWSFPRVLLLFVAALVPFGPFLSDGWLKKQVAMTDDGKPES